MRRLHPSALLIALLVGSDASAQSITPKATVSTGGHGTGSTAMLSWSVGQISGATYTGTTRRITAGLLQPDVVRVALNVRALLAGPYNIPGALMNDGLRTTGLIPLTEPYTAAGFVHHGQGGGETVTAPVLTTTGSNAIVDWVFVELRSASPPTTVFSTRCALVQRDGDVVETDGVSPLRLSAVPGTYHVAVKHRNHLAVMTLNAVALGPVAVPLDFTNGSVATYGTNAQRVDGSVRQLWLGDVTANAQVKYTGSGNDRDPILVTVGSTTPNNVVSGTYSSRDVNMDGSVKYTGSGNDRDPILLTVGSTTPNNVRPAQLP